MELLYKDILSKSKILLLEDEENLRKSFKKVLSLWAKEVFEAANGVDGILMYEKHFPDIIITDIKMPKLSGLEFIEIIRKMNSNIPIIVTSAFTDKDFLLQSIKLSILEYLVKPIQEKNLEKILFLCAKKIMEKSPKYFQIENFGKYDYQNKCFLDLNNNIVNLTIKEIELVELLLRNSGNLITKKEIENFIYPYDGAPPSALKNLVFKLRKKMKYDLIKSVGKLGYKID